MKLDYHYYDLGNFIDEQRKHFNVSMKELCKAIRISTDTYGFLKGETIALFPITKGYWDLFAIFSPKKNF